MNRLQRVAWWIGPLLICLLVHWRSFGAWFSGDDFAWLALGLPRHDYLHAIFAPMAQGTIRPLSERLFFMAGFRLFGLDALPYRIVIFATQLANVALVAWLGARLTGRHAAGALAAILWIVSDTLVEPLGWASAYNQVLCAFFLLLAFHCLLRFLDTGETRYYLFQWLAFLLGLGALEVAVVYPLLAGAYVCLYARKHLVRVWPMLAASVVYTVIHMAVAPPNKDPNYMMHFTGSMLRTLARYWVWTVGPFAFWAPFSFPKWAIAAAVGAISAGLLVYAVRAGGRFALFCLAWFAIAIAPVLPLRDHVAEYYAFLPAIGICWLGGKALVEGMRPIAYLLGGLYIVIMLPRTLAGANFNYHLADRSRALVEGVARAHQLHPGQTILLDGVDSELFYNTILDHPFRLIGVEHVYLTPGSERHIDAHPELGDIGEFLLSSDLVSQGLDNDEVAVYDVRGSKLRNITSSYSSAPRDSGLPRRVDVASALAAPVLGPEWYPPDGNHRWMPKRATLRMAGPSAAGQKLYLRGYYPDDAIRGGPVSVKVTVNGVALAESKIATGGDFELSFPLPDAVAGPEMKVEVEVSRTFHAGSDIRDLGLSFGEFEIR